MTQIRIDAEILIVGNGEHFKNGSVVYENNKITYAGETEHAPQAENTIQTKTIMPGMWDCHTHFMGVTTPSLDVFPSTNPIVGGMRVTRDALEAIKSGFTSVREVGGHGVYLNQVIQEGIIPGPRIYGAGAVLSTTGGHVDLHSFPLDMVLDMSKTGQHLGELADGVGGCLKAVRIQLRKGAEIIKYCASGGVMSFLDDPIHQQFSQEEQNTIVDEASRADRAVAAHCHGAVGIKSALEAGVTTIEHGSYLDEDLAQLMIEKDAILVPTRLIIEKIISSAEAAGVPEYALVKGRNVANHHKEAMKIAVKAGVKIAMGTDYGVSGLNSLLPWGENAQELKYYVAAGMSTSEALVTTTGNGPLTLGKLAPKSGQLKEGYDADLLLLKVNPLEDITLLESRENIKTIVKQGKVVT